MQINLHQRINYKWLAGILLLILISLTFVTCRNERTALANLKAKDFEISTYKLINGQLVSSVTAMQLTEKELQAAVLAKDATLKELSEKFSEVRTVTKVIQGLRIDTMYVPYGHPAPCDFEINDAVITPEYTFAYTSTQDGISITDLHIPDTINIVSGMKRKWFLGKETFTLDLTHSNKYVQTDQIQHFEIRPKKRFWETNLFLFSAGVVTGAMILK